VACQLRILEESQDPSVTQAQSIVSLAKECVQLNDQWAKAHVRLASAYLALDTLLQTKSDSGASTGRIHSNDACLSLQTALRLDPSNRQARTMLVKELSRRDRGRPTGTNTIGSTVGDGDTVVHPPNPLSSQETNHSAGYNVYQDIDITPNDPTWIQRWKLIVQAWLRRHPFFSSNDARDLYIVLLILLFLYISFDGRFGWNNEPQSTRRQTSLSRSYGRPMQDQPIPPQSRRKQPIQIQNQKQQEEEKQHVRVVWNQNHTPTLDWMPLALFFLTMIPFLQPNIFSILPFLGIRFGGYGRGRRPDVGQGLGNAGGVGPSPLLWVATLTLIIILVLGTPMFQQSMGSPIIIHGFIGPWGFPMVGGHFLV
jgi:hypothetical protein